MVIVFGLVLVFDPSHLSDQHPPVDPARRRAICAFALPIAIIAFTGLGGCGQPGRRGHGGQSHGQAAGAPGFDPDRAGLRGDLAGRRRGAAGARRRRPRWARRTSRRRCSAWSRRSSRNGWPTCSSTQLRSGARSGSSRPPARRCSASRGWAIRWRPTARSRARSGACTRAGAPRT